MTFNDNLFALSLLALSTLGSGLAIASHAPQSDWNPIERGVASLQADTAPIAFVEVLHAEVEITHIQPPTQAEIAESQRVSDIFESASVEVVHHEVEINGVTIINGGDDFPVNG